MAVAQTAARISKQAGNGSTTAFSGSWKIFTKNELRVEKINAAGVYSGALTVDVDYTVVFDTAAETWTVTYTVAPVSSGYAVIIGSETPYTQATNFPREGVVPMSTLRDTVDKLTVLVQQLENRLDRALVQPITPVSPAVIDVDPGTDRRALIYQDNGDGTWTVVPSSYDPDELVNEVTILAAAYSSGLASAKPAAPAARKMYYSTDTDQLEMYIPDAGRWFLIG